MKDIHLITVGKLKDSRLESIEMDYLKRIDSFNFKIIEVKSHKENKDLEDELMEFEDDLDEFLNNYSSKSLKFYS